MKARILIVDDESVVRDSLSEWFTTEDYETRGLASPREALEVVEKEEWDLALIDLKMPGIDGDEVLSLITSMRPSPRVIFVTAYDDGGKTRARLLKMGAYAYFDKPIASLASRVADGTIHYGDPPNAECCASGPTMNSEPARQTKSGA